MPNIPGSVPHIPGLMYDAMSKMRQDELASLVSIDDDAIRLAVASLIEDPDILYSMRFDNNEYVRLMVVARTTNQDRLWEMRNDTYEICRYAIGYKLTSPSRTMEILSTLNSEDLHERLTERLFELQSDTI